MTIYRKIYQRHYGPIPVDERGQPYHIHHIDGNHRNNAIENLLCVSAEEHYRIHLQQGDYWAAAILQKSYDSDFDRSRFVSEYNKEQYARGNHPMQRLENKIKSSDTQSKIVASGNHVFQSEQIQNTRSERSSKSNQRLVAAGAHVFQSDQIKHNRSTTARNAQIKLVEQGKHHFLDSQAQRERGAKANSKMLANGTHPTQRTKVCPHCEQEIRLTTYGRYHGDRCKLK